MSHSGVFFLSLSAEEEEEEVVVEWRVERGGGGDKKIHLLTDSAILDFFCSSSVTWSAAALTRGGLSRTKT